MDWLLQIIQYRNLVAYFMHERGSKKREKCPRMLWIKIITLKKNLIFMKLVIFLNVNTQWEKM